MERPRHTLLEELSIRKLVTFYYRELTKQFYTSGERHDFWEIVYVDKGEVDIFTDAGNQRLKQGDLIFYKPNVFHGGRAANDKAPNLIILSFECSSPCMRAFEDKTIRLLEEERLLLSRIVREGLQAFEPAIDSPHIANCPSSREGAPFGGEQLIRNYLEILLIQLYRRTQEVERSLHPSSVVAEAEGDEVVDAVVHYLREHLSDNFTLDQLCERFTISRTRLKTLFRAKTGCGVMEYFNLLKISRAKQLMREHTASFSDVAERLGYSSVHYFSKQFKRISGMSPSEYVRSVQARTASIRGRDATGGDGDRLQTGRDRPDWQKNGPQ
ncbi:AraC family transcriptional regulator [Paenibacillus flagellatus]|uniref:AraC family transcriptional regulator n=1 Tax=Paenibacillus flagellatus TaxID=2211139 RepID=A0A2V5KHK6_9BACL|nr:AraC family transcriptional regulator [Paenibacillus flagellatus]PYI53820.1 AraC family transcriptional regulator [Paenibacillus flagellatus]